MTTYLQEVAAQLNGLGRADRQRALEALESQLHELSEAGIDPIEALGDAADYAAELTEALTEEASAEPQLRVLGVPVEARGINSAEIRSRAWDPESPRLLTPRLLGAGWTINLGALAVKLGLIRPDDATDDVLDAIPEGALRAAQSTPLLIAAATAGTVALLWRTLPDELPSGFDLLGRPKRMGGKPSIIGTLALGAAPALWAARWHAPPEDRLVRAAQAAAMTTFSASVAAATVLSTHRPEQRWGLLVPAAIPLAVAMSLGVIVIPIRAGLRRVWRTAARQ